MARRPLFQLTHLGWGLAVSVLVLTVLGMSAIRATDRTVGADAGPTMNREFAPTPPSLLRIAQQAIGTNTLRQGIYFVTGIALLLLTLASNYRRLGDYAYLIYWITIAALLLLLLDRYGADLPFVRPRRDTWRWIEFGEFGLQPSEFMKVALILGLARYLRFRDSYRTWPGLIPPFLMTVLPMVLILKQPDLGTLLMLLPVLFAMLFAAGARLRHLAIIVVSGLALLPVFYFFGMHDYQRQRFLVLLKQNTADERWHMNEGFQLRQSLIALGTGGVRGQGWAEGAFVQHKLLPEEHNDFIFAILGHQWGLAGAIVILLAYIWITVLGFEVAGVTNDPFGRLLAVGVVAMIVAQALLNVCMTLGLAPITGMTLPFVSYGGSSLWANFIALGLLISVAQHRPLFISNPPFEHRD